ETCAASCSKSFERLRPANGNFETKRALCWESDSEMDWLPDNIIDHLREAIDTPDLTGSPYVIERELGRGGMGTVYLAHDSRLQRAVALKVLSPLHAEAESVARLWREARILAGLEHPGIVPIHDVASLPDGRAYYVMKFVEGSRLDEYLQSSPAVL